LAGEGAKAAVARAPAFAEQLPTHHGISCVLSVLQEKAYQQLEEQMAKEEARKQE
jgi:hypothetical protein